MYMADNVNRVIHQTPDKQIVLVILEQLKPYWDMAEWFLVVVQQSDNQEILDELWRLICAWVNTITDEKKKEYIKTQLLQIKSLRLAEEESSSKDQKDADTILDGLLNDIG